MLPLLRSPSHAGRHISPMTSLTRFYIPPARPLDLSASERQVFRDANIIQPA